MVTFDIKVYENDWRYLLKDGFLKQILARCNYPFSSKNLFINNVKNIDEVKFYAEKLKFAGTIDYYYVVEDYSDEALRFFDISKNSFGGGYYYSIAELVSIFLCETSYLLHFSSDSFIAIDSVDSNWIAEAISIMDRNSDIVVANPVWNFKFSEAAKESFKEINTFYLSYGFSDQCFLAKTAFFRGKIYNEENPFSERYPKYGGNLFEKRIDAFLRNNNYKRLTSKTAVYIHHNYCRGILHRLLYRLFPQLHAKWRFRK